jgi:serine/threonine protein kinase
VEDDRGRLQILKLITDITDDAPGLASLLDQVRQALPLHPALLQVTEVGTSDEGVYLASPVLTAPSVEGRLRGGRQSLEATLPWLRAVTAGLQAAHDAGVWHGAIHPRDVLVTDDGGVLTGVGVAPVLEHLKLQAPVRVPFTAPERASGQAWDARADQYSLAMLALDALSGRRLIAGTIPAFDRWTLAETPAEDARLHDVFVRALDPDPDRRYASVEEWLAELAGPERIGESGALSRFARDGVILAGPVAGTDVAREIKVQTIDDQKGDSLSLFPEESTVESQVVESPPTPGDAVEPAQAVSEPDQEQEWLVADVPDETTSVEPEVDPFAMRYAPAPPASPAGADTTPSQDWRIDDREASDATDTTGMFGSGGDESPSRRPWLLAAVMLVLVALGYGTWRSLQSPAAPASTSPAPTGLSAADGRPEPTPEPPTNTSTPEPREPAGSDTPRSDAAPRAVPQAPVPQRPTAPATRPVTPPASVEPRAPAPASAGTGRVLIRSSPSGEVRVNGVVRGETPVVLRDLPYGVYAIAIARSGFEPIEREITLQASEPVASLSVDLRRQGPGGPAATAAQPTAAPPPTSAPTTPSPTTAAPSTPSTPAAPAPAPSSTAPGPATSQATGGIFVTSTPSQARLIVDGQAYGSTPASVPGLSVGAHTVRVEAPGYRPWEGRVAVLAGTRVRVTATLQQGQE